MPFDPNIPAANSPNSSAQMRSQLNGLKDLIDALPSITAAVVDGVSTVNPGDAATVSLSVVGQTLHFSFGIPRGQDGPAGPVFGNTVVDGVTTLNPGEAATVQTSFDGSNVRFQFGIPRGNDGSSGTNGSDGMQGPPFTNFVVDNVTSLPPGSWPNVSANFDGTAVRLNFGIPQGLDGPQGATGAQGPAFANAVVDGVTTLNPGENATVQTNFDGSNVRFQFGIPRGQTGNDGMQGPQGPPGEVTNAQLTSAINGTSSNSNGVNTLVMTVSDPPTVGEVQAIADKLDELILALRR